MRVDHWDHALTRWATKQVGLPFVWGVTDCASLARGALEAMYGRDLLALPGWATLREAVVALQAHPILEELAALGAKQVARNFDQEGDIFFWPPAEDGFPGIGVRFARNLLLTHEERGVTAPPYRLLDPAVLAQATVWRVPIDG